MSFTIFASGVTGHHSGPYNYSKNNCLEEDDFSPSSLMSLIPTSPNAAGVAESVFGSPESNIGDATVRGMSKIAQMQFVHLVVTGVNMLALHGSRGEINLFCYQKNKLWADGSSSANFEIRRGGNPGRDFIRAIGPGLIETDLNNFGVLAHIAMALSEYERVLAKSAPSHLNITIKH